MARENGRRTKQSTGVIVGRIGVGLLELGQKEVELVRAELVSQARAARTTLIMLLAATVAGLTALNLLLMALVLALAEVMAAWLAALLLALVALGVGAIIGYAGWRRRPRSPLVLTRKSLKEDWEWLKQQLA